MDINNIDYFDPLLKPRVAYRFSSFICEKSKPYQQTLENEISLKFEKITKFETLTGKESEFPDHHFDFIAYNQLLSRITWDELDLSAMYYPLEMQARLKNTDERWTLKTGNITEFTMWDDMAKQFNKEEIQKLPPLVIIVVSSCRVNKYRDIQLAATPATHYYINPQAPEVGYIYTV
ncbi:nucleic acid-binding, OB-fold protein [Tanacetum coccineum]|uniref:Nucleic acid-binding, OB-fold protein n=1 Tax=Tanacetum coccineum TaxID=301880 RepID=A0ABQ4Y9L9_9ASTR